MFNFKRNCTFKKNGLRSTTLDDFLAPFLALGCSHYSRIQHGWSAGLDPQNQHHLSSGFNSDCGEKSPIFSVIGGDTDILLASIHQHSLHEQCVEDMNKSTGFFVVVFLLNIIISFHGIMVLPYHFLKLQREG